MLCKCDNCGHELDDSKLDFYAIVDLADRIEPGGIVPAGDCPKCGALCYPSSGVNVAAPELFVALEAFVEPWSKGGRDWESKLTYGTFHNARKAIAKARGEQ